MAVLNEGQRRKLEKTVERARGVAELGARAAIEQLAVHRAEPYGHLSADQRELRNRLRARARQLGDKRDARTGMHQIDHLMVESAYEHWHRMLFARFLAENQVLMHPDGVAVTLEECEELAPDEGAEDGWELAARYAAGMLPQIFRPGSPVFELKLPPEKSRQLERLLAELSAEVFKASDSLGWVYQFWQAKKKDEVNRSEVKIGADELPAVTQLFTEPYMVQFLLHNTLGAWWVGRHGRDSLPIEMPYLRFQDDGGTPAAGTFDGWPKTAAELSVLDPCCGSGHFLVAAFEILVRFRMVEEELSPAEACDAVLWDNLHGLEIDERCTQIAAFALALAAWTFPGAGGHRALPELHVACSGLAPRAQNSEWLDLAGDDVRLRNGMARLYELFQYAPVLGSLIDPGSIAVSGQQQELGIAGFEELRPLLDARLLYESTTAGTLQRELGTTARGIADAARLLSGQYHLVVTNVPYLLRGKQNARLQAHCERYYAPGAADLATVFLHRCRRFSADGGVYATVTPQNWLFLSSYKALRRQLLTDQTLTHATKIGSGATSTASWDVLRALTTVVQSSPADTNHIVTGIETSAPSEEERAVEVRAGVLLASQRNELLDSPDATISLAVSMGGELFAKYAYCYQGISTSDNPRLTHFWWEQCSPSPRWVPLQGPPKETTEFAGREKAVDWQTLSRGVDGAAVRGSDAWGRKGVVIAQMRSLPATFYDGDKFANTCPVIVPHEERWLPAVWAFTSSDEFCTELRKINSKLSIDNGYVTKIPFDFKHWTQIAAERYPDGLPDPQTDGIAQWIFDGDIRHAADALHAAVARLLGHGWPDQIKDGLDALVDDDGIVCLPAVRGEQPAETRLGRVLARAFGDDWSAHRQAQLLADAGCKGWALDRWLQDRFFAQHCKLFHHRPFIWHIWDGIKKGGFSALVNYRKLDRKLLETLTYNYLGDWIRRQQDGVKRAEDGAEDRLGAAQALETKLEHILEGEPPCDIFVRWKPIEEQPMGWNPDINDGVRMNIRPFMLAGDVGKKGAGVLRDRPNIRWNKDRGRDPSDAPWYHLGPECGGKDGDRINDHHLTLAEKQAAQDAVGGRT